MTNPSALLSRFGRALLRRNQPEVPDYFALRLQKLAAPVRRVQQPSAVFRNRQSPQVA